MDVDKLISTENYWLHNAASFISDTWPRVKLAAEIVKNNNKIHVQYLARNTVSAVDGKEYIFVAASENYYFTLRKRTVETLISEIEPVIVNISQIENGTC
jgi:hypothetical protein